MSPPPPKKKVQKRSSTSTRPPLYRNDPPPTARINPTTTLRTHPSMARAAAARTTATACRAAAGQQGLLAVIAEPAPALACPLLPFSKGQQRFSSTRPRGLQRALPLLLSLLALLAPVARGADVPGSSGASIVIRDDLASSSCVPSTLNFVGVDAAAAALVAAKTNPTALVQSNQDFTISLPLLKAVDDCGNELPIVLEMGAWFNDDARPSLAPGSTLDLRGLPCGAHTVSYLAELQSGELLAVKDFTFEVECLAAS